MTSIKIHIINLRRRLESKRELDVMWCNFTKRLVWYFYMRYVVTDKFDARYDDAYFTV